jgi:hypothetical protein
MIEGVGAGAIGPGGGIRQRPDPRRLSGAWRPLRHLFGAGLGADDIRLDDDVGRPTDHQEMLDIVPSHQHQAPPTIHGRGIDHRQAGHAPAIGTGPKAIVGESANQPGGGADQRQHGHEGEKEGQCRHALSPANATFVKPRVRERGAPNGEEA